MWLGARSALVGCACVMVSLSSAAGARTIFVDATCAGPGSGTEADPFCSIQDAIDDAVDTDEIIVGPGTYFENISFFAKAITVRSSDGPEVTTIDGDGSGTVVKCNSGEGPATVLDGFVLTGGDSVIGGGMQIAFSSPTVLNCTFLGNMGGGMRTSGGFGVVSPTVINCIFRGNSAVANGGAMYNGSATPTVIDCTFSGNSTEGNGGGMYNTNSTVMVTNCTFSGNSAFTQGGGGMYNLDSTATVTNCSFTGNTALVRGGGGMFNEASDSTVINCLFSGNLAGADGGAGMFNDGSNPTIIDCTFSTNVAILEGGAVYNFDSNPVMTGCMFMGNLATTAGGAVSNRQFSDVELINCLFVGNSTIDGGGLYVSTNSSVSVTGSDFDGNAANGGGAAFILGTATFTETAFIGNTANFDGGAINSQGVDVGGLANVTLANCLFHSNAGLDAAGAAVTNLFGGSMTVTNCTFADNAGASTGGLASFESTTTVANCIFWGNTPAQMAHSGSGTTVSYSDVQGGWIGLGNIDADPLFIDTGSGDYRVDSQSPCVDAGNNWAIVNVAEIDLEGAPRFADDPATPDAGCGAPVIVDMGAYEYQGVPAEIVFADLDGDGVVGVADLRILNDCVGSTDPDCCIADLDLDGEVTMSDRLLLWAGMVEKSRSLR